MKSTFWEINLRFWQRLIFWLIVLLVVYLSLNLIQEILPPFIIGVLFAYFLNPLIELFKRFKIGRLYATIIVSILFFTLVIFLFIILIPLIYDQIGQFINFIPNMKNFIDTKIVPIISQFVGKFDPEVVVRIKHSITNFNSYIFDYIAKLMSKIWHSGVALIHIISFTFLTPILTFYFLRDWEIIIKKFHDIIPIKIKKDVRKNLNAMDDIISGYIRGQFNVCLFLMIFYSIGLYIVGLKFSLFVGILTGLLCLIPLIGFFIGASSGIIIAFVQFDDIKNVLMVAGVFLLGQIIEGNFLTPKLVGEKVGLHPVLVIFALLVGGHLFGFLGILISVPVAGILGVLVKTFMSFYFKSTYYKE